MLFAPKSTPSDPAARSLRRTPARHTAVRHARILPQPPRRTACCRQHELRSAHRIRKPLPLLGCWEHLIIDNIWFNLSFDRYRLRFVFSAVQVPLPTSRDEAVGAPEAPFAAPTRPQRRSPCPVFSLSHCGFHLSVPDLLVSLQACLSFVLGSCCITRKSFHPLGFSVLWVWTRQSHLV